MDSTFFNSWRRTKRNKILFFYSLVFREIACFCWLGKLYIWKRHTRALIHRWPKCHMHVCNEKQKNKMIRHTELIFIESHFYVDICSLFYITIMKICRRGGAGSKQNETNCSCFRVNTSSFVSSIPSIKATMSLNTSHFHNWAAAIMAVWQHCLAGVAAILHSILLIKWSPKDIALNLF